MRSPLLGMDMPELGGLCGLLALLDDDDDDGLLGGLGLCGLLDLLADGLLGDDGFLVVGGLGILLGVGFVGDKVWPDAIGDGVGGHPGPPLGQNSSLAGSSLSWS